MPSELDHLVPGLGIIDLLGRRGARQAPACRAPVENEMAHPLRMSNRVGDPGRAATFVPEQDESLEACGVDNAFQVLDVLLERELDPIPIGQTAATPIISDEGMASTEHREPG